MSSFDEFSLADKDLFIIKEELTLIVDNLILIPILYINPLLILNIKLMNNQSYFIRLENIICILEEHFVNT